MINRGIAGAIAGGVAIIAVFVAMSSAGFLQPPADQEQFVMRDVELSLSDVRVTSIDEEKAVIEVLFDAYNPNRGSVVLEAIQYFVFANGVRVAVGEIGERAEGFWQPGTGRTFTMYGDYSMPFRDRLDVSKTVALEPIWDDLQNNDVSWRISGTYFFTDPLRGGGQEIDFEFIL